MTAKVESRPATGRPSDSLWRKLRRVALRRVLPPLVLLAVIVTLWQQLVFNHLFGLATYTVPQPSTILSTMRADWANIWMAQKLTLTEAIEGYLIGGAVGLAVAVIIVAVGRGARLFMSLAGIVNAIPIVALAPVLILYLGYGEQSKVAVAALLCGAIVLLNAIKGLLSVKTDPVLLMHTYAAPRWRVILSVRLPTALPFIFTALKYNVTIALVATIISEFFGGYGGVGVEMEQAVVQFAMADAWAALLLVGLIGVVWFEVVAAVEYLATRRHASTRAASLS